MIWLVYVYIHRPPICERVGKTVCQETVFDVLLLLLLLLLLLYYAKRQYKHYNCSIQSKRP